MAEQELLKSFMCFMCAVGTGHWVPLPVVSWITSTSLPEDRLSGLMQRGDIKDGGFLD